MIVVDTSAVIAALAGHPRPLRLADRLRQDGDLHVPHLLDVEVLHALRGLVIGGKLSEERADGVRQDLAALRLRRYPHGPLADRIWELRGNLTAYDAAFVALSEALDAPLITCDAKLLGGDHDARVELFARS